MLEIIVPGVEECWDERTQEFVSTKEQTLKLEHSLVSLSKWESKWHKPFIGKNDLTTEETISYIQCMTVTPNVDPSVYYRLSDQNVSDILVYINDPMTATTINNRGNTGSSREQVTSELIYYWMIALNIPVEFEKWHLNRLLTLIRVCEIKSTPPKKMSKGEIMKRNAQLNAERRRRLNSKG